MPPPPALIDGGEEEEPEGYVRIWDGSPRS